MNFSYLIGFIGWITAISFGIAILNFFVKYINKKFIIKLGKDKKVFVNIYRKIMRIIVKYHKLIGSVAVISVVLHLSICIYYHWIRVSGVIAAIIMGIIFILGFYGAYINKNMKGIWLKIHRILALSLIIVVAVHLVFKSI